MIAHYSKSWILLYLLHEHAPKLKEWELNFGAESEYKPFCIFLNDFWDIRKYVLALIKSAIL